MKLTDFHKLHILRNEFKNKLSKLQENDVLLTFHLNFDIPTLSIHRSGRDSYIEEFEYFQNGVMYRIEDDFTKNEFMYYINKIEGLE